MKRCKERERERERERESKNNLDFKAFVRRERA